MRIAIVPFLLSHIQCRLLVESSELLGSLAAAMIDEDQNEDNFVASSEDSDPGKRRTIA